MSTTNLDPVFYVEGDGRRFRLPVGLLADIGLTLKDQLATDL